MSRAHKHLLLLAAATTAIAVLSPVAAAAKSGGPAAESHCVVSVIGESDDGELTMSAPDCYSSGLGALAAASAEIGGDGISHPLGSSTFTLGIHYDGYNGTGSSITVVGSSCTGGYWNTPSWFDNRTSSSYNGCYRLRHYDKPYRRGSSTNTYGVGQIDNLAAWMNNRTESVSYHSS